MLLLEISATVESHLWLLTETLGNYTLDAAVKLKLSLKFQSQSFHFFGP